MRITWLYILPVHRSSHGLCRGGRGRRWPVPRTSWCQPKIFQSCKNGQTKFLLNPKHGYKFSKIRLASGNHKREWNRKKEQISHIWPPIAIKFSYFVPAHSFIASLPPPLPDISIRSCTHLLLATKQTLYEYKRKKFKNVQDYNFTKELWNIYLAVSWNTRGASKWTAGRWSSNTPP